MKIAVMGYGTVGSGVCKVLSMNREKIAEKSPCGPIEVKYILDIKEINDENARLVVRDINTILDDDEVKIVVETMGGLRFAYDYVTRCLKCGKSVVTSNKELVAEKGPELLALACENNCRFEFEAAVAGGIPVIRAITDGLNANQITDIAGIVNGTTNFILSKMFNESMPYETALALAQKNGYAEQDPTADVEGIDACRKICILSALAYGRHVLPADVPTKGISGVKAEDVAAARSLGYKIKLIARSRKLGNKISVNVCPCLVKAGGPLGMAEDVNNAVLVKGNAVGEVMFYGPGAGSLPTASAVVSDVMDCAAKYGVTPQESVWKEYDPDFLEDFRQTDWALFIRLEGSCNENDVMSSFGKADRDENGDYIIITDAEIQDSASRKLRLFSGKVITCLRVLPY